MVKDGVKETALVVLFRCMNVVVTDNLLVTYCNRAETDGRSTK